MRFPLLRLGLKGHRDEAFRTILACLILQYERFPNLSNWFADTELSAEEENELRLLIEAHRRMTAAADNTEEEEDNNEASERENMARLLWEIREQVLGAEYTQDETDE